MSSPQVNVVQTNSSSSTPVTIANGIVSIQLPSTLTNAILNVTFTSAGSPVTASITGSMTVSGQYQQGRIQSLTTMNLGTTNAYSILGKFTSILVHVTALTNADTVIVNLDQCENIIN